MEYRGALTFIVGSFVVFLVIAYVVLFGSNSFTGRVVDSSYTESKPFDGNSFNLRYIGTEKSLQGVKGIVEIEDLKGTSREIILSYFAVASNGEEVARGNEKYIIGGLKKEKYDFGFTPSSKGDLDILVFVSDDYTRKEVRSSVAYRGFTGFAVFEAGEGSMLAVILLIGIAGVFVFRKMYFWKRARRLSRIKNYSGRRFIELDV